MEQLAVKVEGHGGDVGQIHADALDQHEHRLQQVAQQRQPVAHLVRARVRVRLRVRVRVRVGVRVSGSR